VSRLSAVTDHVTPYDRFCRDDAEVERLLLAGEPRAALEAYFGAREYRELTQLAAAAARGPVDESLPHVLIVPGILGSQLGVRRRAPLPDDVLWLDPLDIQGGRLALLEPQAGAPIVPLGVVLYSYLKLKLRLRAAGFPATLHDYDWRLDIDSLGEALAARLRAHAARPAAIVAHSMGGLVSRVALGLEGTAHVRRVVLLGTPNQGAFAPLQALRGTYSVVRNIARLDLGRSALELAEQVFGGFPSLYQMLPHATTGGLDLADALHWPVQGPQPRKPLLAGARRLQAALPMPDERFTAIAGVGQHTVTAAARREDGFLYTVTGGGDGTVPTSSAAPRGMQAYYTRAAHSDLTRDAQVAAAIIDVLKLGATERLPVRWASRAHAYATISDRQLERLPAGKLDWARLTPLQRQAFLDNLNQPPPLRLRLAPGAGDLN
jgi:pimeloyl-ACP methyl ester carboxylesterase